MTFAVHVFGGKQRSDEKLGKTVDRFRQSPGFNVKEIVGVFVGGESVVAAAVRADELLIAVGLRVFFGTQEQHVLKKMSQPRAFCRVGIGAYSDIHGYSCLIGSEIGDHHCAQAVAQLQVAVFTRLQWSGDDVSPDRLRREEQQQQQYESQWMM